MSDERDPVLPFVASEANVPIDDASFFRALLEAIPAAVVRVDPDQRISYINRLRGGVTLQQVVGRPARDFIAPEDYERWQHAIDTALRTGKPISYTVMGTHPVHRGRRAFYEGHAVPLDNGDGRRAVCIIAFDVSEQVARAEVMSANEEKLRVAVEATGIGLWTWDIDNDRVEWDERLIEIMGRTPVLPEEYVERVVHPEDRARVHEAIADNRKGRTALAAHRIIRPDGQVRWLLPCGRRTLGAPGRGARMFGGFVDVTAERELEAHLQRAQKLNAVGSMTAGVAHNFNNMLAIITPALELMARKQPPADGQMLEDALHAAGRAAELVRQLMTFAGQRLPSVRRALDLDALLERTLAMCRRTFEQQVRIDSELGPGSARVLGDAAAVEQVVINVLINARDALAARDAADRAQPHITVQLSCIEASDPADSPAVTRRYARVRVSDNGVGMSGRVKQHLFEPFFTTKPVGEGTGLGLATSYGIVREHGGFISIESELGAGTTVDIFLPTTHELPVVDQTEPSVSRAARKGTVLLVDDEPALRRVVEMLLQERRHHVHSAADGEQAVAALEAGVEPDVILLDRSMPGWPVHRTLSELRQRAPHAKLVFFTGQSVPEAERDQVHEVLHKPLSIQNLVHTVERLLA